MTFLYETISAKDKGYFLCTWSCIDQSDRNISAEWNRFSRCPAMNFVATVARRIQDGRASTSELLCVSSALEFTGLWILPHFIISLSIFLCGSYFAVTYTKMLGCFRRICFKTVHDMSGVISISNNRTHDIWSLVYKS